jgi:transcriptional regulator with XRE-family HTH domain
MHTLNEKVSLIRKRLGLAQKEVAAKLGMKPTNYSNYETGINKIDAEFLERIAIVFGCTAEYIKNYNESLYVENVQNSLIAHNVQNNTQTSFPDGVKDIMASFADTLNKFGELLSKFIGNDNTKPSS